MNEPTLQKITAELSDQIIGQKFGKIFALAKLQIAIDFRTSDGDYLLISVEPNSPRIYLIRRKLKELEKQSKLQLSFASFLRKRLAHSVLQAIEKIENERILKLFLVAQDEFGQTQNYTLLVQLTGRSSNLFLLDQKDYILDSLRDTFGNGQEIASKYSPPVREGDFKRTQDFEVFPKGRFETLSAALDKHYLDQQNKQVFIARSQSARSAVSKEIKKNRRLIKQLNKDLKNHGDAENWKKLGDLLLANVATAQRMADKISVVDYFDEKTPTIEIQADENLSITETAEKYFKRYTKARNAKAEISKRLTIAEKQIAKLLLKKEKIENAILQNDLETIESFIGKKKSQQIKNKKGKKDQTTYYREFVSSDGFDIFVGKRSKDNDYLTFRIAKSLDTWLHAADYPGSHVVIRNPNRKDIPHQTIVEAAQLAAFYSKAKSELKVGVHYTQKKFVNKPKGAAAGLVSLSSFKTILVQPKTFKQKNSE